MPINWGLATEPLNGLEALRYYGQAQMDQFQRAQLQDAMAERQQKLQQRQQVMSARPQIQQQIAAGDFGGARQAAAAAGDFDYLPHIKGLEESKRAQLAQEAELLGRTAFALKRVAPEQRASVLASMVPQLKATGYFSDEEIASASHDLSDAVLDGYIATATSLKDQMEAFNKANEPKVLGRGDELWAGGQRIGANTQAPPPDYVFDQESGDWLLKPGTGGGMAVGGAAPAAAPASFSGADEAFQRLIQVESGGRAGVTGPETPYGRAQGMTQMLPSTAMSMAQKLGMPWRPDLMTGTSPEAARYQQTLGRAYFDEGLQKYGGDISKAAMYYHGGPDESMWGPRTRAYAQKVAGGGPAQSGGSPTRIPSGRGPKRQQAPSGFEYDGSGGLSPIRGGPADPSAPAEAMKTEGSLRKEFDDQAAAKEFKIVRPAYNTLARLANAQNERVRTGKEPSAADDIAMVFAYMKILDPNSVVRETEYATAQNAAGVPERARNLYNKLKDGSFLSPSQRQEFVAAAGQSYQTRRQAYNDQADRYRELAREYGVNENRIAPYFLTNDELRQRQSQRRGGDAARLKAKYGLR